MLFLPLAQPLPQPGLGVVTPLGFEIGDVEAVRQTGGVDGARLRHTFGNAPHYVPAGLVGVRPQDDAAAGERREIRVAIRA